MKEFNAYEFRLTMIDNASLLERLARELRFHGQQVRKAWPDFKNDPIRFGRRIVVEGRLRLRRRLAAPNSLAAITAALLIMISAVVILLLSGRVSKENERKRGDEELAQISMLNFPSTNAIPDGHGVGANSQGRVGFAHGNGEGSAPAPKKSTGGGGGGDHNPLQAQEGRVPPPSPIPAPIPKFPPVQKQSLPVAGVDIDPALWKNLPMAGYGDPRSQSSVPSNGPGAEGGMGTGNGTGIGGGSRAGVGPGTPVPILTFGISSTSTGSGNYHSVVVRDSSAVRTVPLTRSWVAGNCPVSTAGTLARPPTRLMMMLVGPRTGMRRATQSESNRSSLVRIVVGWWHRSYLAVIRKAFTRASGTPGQVKPAIVMCSDCPAIWPSTWAYPRNLDCPGARNRDWRFGSKRSTLRTPSGWERSISAVLV